MKNSGNKIATIGKDAPEDIAEHPGYKFAVDKGEKAKRGRPTITAPRPWDSEGMSRRTWYRRRQAEKREGGK